MKYEAYAPAKINLGLEIISKRNDGYHNVDMIMQTVNLFDKISIEKSKDKNINIVHLKPINCPKTKDITYKCAKLFFEYLNKPITGLNIIIDKKIPLSSGLAGGSTNGAAVLMLLNYMYKNPFSIEKLEQIGSLVGADIPFCVMGGTARASQTGTVLKKIPTFKDYLVVLIKPDFSVSTKEAYNLTDKIVKKEIKNFNALQQSIINNNLEKMCLNLFNRFEDITPQINFLKEEFINLGAKNSLMSGSGPSVYGIFQDYSTAYKCFEILSKKYHDIFLCSPINYGIKIKRAFS